MPNGMKHEHVDGVLWRTIDVFSRALARIGRAPNPYAAIALMITAVGAEALVLMVVGKDQYLVAGFAVLVIAAVFVLAVLQGRPGSR